MRSGFKLGTFLALFMAAGMDACGSDTPAASTCGNGVIEGDEKCDGLAVNNQTCASINMGTSTAPLTCDSTCNFVLTACAGGGGGAGGMMP
jgi:hypothetical protein